MFDWISYPFGQTAESYLLPYNKFTLLLLRYVTVPH